MDQQRILYNMESCPECQRVREMLYDRQLTYLCVNVPKNREARAEVFKASSQYSVPTFVDGDTVLFDLDEILTYLDKNYPVLEEPDCGCGAPIGTCGL